MCCLSVFRLHRNKASRTAGSRGNSAAETQRTDRTDAAERETDDKAGDSTAAPILNGEQRKEYRDSAGNLIYYQIMTYNDQGQIIRRATFDPDGTELCGYDYTYREDGQRLTGAWCFTGDGLLMPVEYFYNDEGQLVKEWWHGSERYNTVGNMSLYTYDEKGRIAIKEYYSRWLEDNSHDEPCYIFHEYNEQDKVVKQTGYYDLEKTNKNYTRIYEYTDFGKLARYTNYTATDDLNFWVIYLYDGETCIGTETYNSDGTLTSSTRK